jgi:hypothetical protein
MKAKNPQFNYVACHTKHKTAFDGVRGKDWGHSHQEFDIKVGGTIGSVGFHISTRTLY